MIIASTFFVSLISFIGVFSLALKEEQLKRMLLVLVALSAGALMGGAFLHLIPEAIKQSSENVFSFVLIGFVLFFFIEKILHWRHCHDGKCSIHTFAYLNLLGDGIHNFVDGIIIAASFLSNLSLGVTTTFAIALHEIPQEIGDFGVLLYAGINRTKALLFNFICALAAIAGGIFAYFLYYNLISSSFFLLPFAAGGFVYIAATDLIPEIKKEISLKKSLPIFFVFILGILIMFLLKG